MSSLLQKVSGSKVYVAYVRPYLPERLRKRLVRWRMTPLATRLFGPRYRRSRDRVEIDITYSCNLRCFNCDRSCQQDPTNDRMSVEQVRRFLEESRANGIQWTHIRLLGGEPTTHPQFLDIVKLALEYRDMYFPSAKVRVCTNGYGERVNRMLALLPPGVEVENSAKTSRFQVRFQTFNVAPIDLDEYARADFSNGCCVTESFGMGVTPYGYYPCAVAGGIDRVFGFNLGRKTLPDRDDDLKEELRRFCAVCGHFKLLTREALVGPVMSRTWKKAYADLYNNPTKLPRLAEGTLIHTLPESKLPSPNM